MTIGRPTDPAHTYLGFLLSQTTGALHRATAEALAPIGLFPRGLGVLETLAAHGAMSQRAIGQVCRVDRTTMVAIIDELVAARFVARRIDPADRRAHLIRITAAGTAVLGRARLAARGVEDAHFAALAPAERDLLRDLLQRVLPEGPGCT